MDINYLIESEIARFTENIDSGIEFRDVETGIGAANSYFEFITNLYPKYFLSSQTRTVLVFGRAQIICTNDFK